MDENSKFSMFKKHLRKLENGLNELKIYHSELILKNLQNSNKNDPLVYLKTYENSIDSSLEALKQINRSHLKRYLRKQNRSRIIRKNNAKLSKNLFKQMIDFSNQQVEEIHCQIQNEHDRSKHQQELNLLNYEDASVLLKEITRKRSELISTLQKISSILNYRKLLKSTKLIPSETSLTKNDNFEKTLEQTKQDLSQQIRLVNIEESSICNRLNFNGYSNHHNLPKKKKEHLETSIAIHSHYLTINYPKWVKNYKNSVHAKETGIHNRSIFNKWLNYQQ